MGSQRQCSASHHAPDRAVGVSESTDGPYAVDVRRQRRADVGATHKCIDRDPECRPVAHDCRYHAVMRGAFFAWTKTAVSCVVVPTRVTVHGVSVSMTWRKVYGL